MVRHISCLATLLALTAAAAGQTVPVPNASFEEGDGKPAGWTLSGGQGEWLDAGAADGHRALAVTGTGKSEDANAWRSDALPFEPGGLYRLRFMARSLGGRGGTPTTGPTFCNRDLGDIPETWQAYDWVFLAPKTLAPEEAHLRFGQWEVKGGIAFDAVELCRAQPVYARAGDLALGDGETLDGNRYTFVAPLGSAGGNFSRPLAGYAGGYFNSNRWCLGAAGEIVYRHHVAGRKATAAEIEVSTCWYASGELAIDASADGKAWQTLGSIDQVASAKLAVPAALLPAEAVWVRLRGRPKEVDGKPAGGTALQVGFYALRATLDGPPATLVGRTQFLAVTQADPRLKVEIDSVGDALPGGDNRVTGRVVNTTGAPLAVLRTVTVDGRPPPASEFTSLGPGESPLDMRYAVPGPGTHTLAITCAAPEPPGGGFAAEVSFHVADLYNTSFGERLPSSSGKVGLWWASSGWKVSRTRPVPEAKGEAVLLRAARNEAEAAQVILRPQEALKGLAVKAGPLAGPGGAAISAECVEVLRVRYVTITQPTDATGCAGEWPDPLPPLRAPLDLEAGRNQPLWVRVTVPKDAAPGAYTGKIALAAEGWRAEVPVRVEVYGFALPDRMTCQTSFGLPAGDIWRYQGLQKEEDRQAVLEKYLACLSAHHISPYDPAPLDPFKVTWPARVSVWEGGMIDPAEKHGGRASLRVSDKDPKANLSAAYKPLLATPKDGLHLRFWYRTGAPGHRFIVALNYYDADGQWMSGRNRTLPVQGSGAWQPFDATVTEFPEGARSVRLVLWATEWTEDGAPTGDVWYDDLALTDAGTGKDLVAGGTFEPPDPADLAPTIDWSAWDAAMTRAIDRHHFNAFSVPIVGMGGGSFHSRVDPELLGYKEDTPEYKAAFTAYGRAVQEHLRQKGWLPYAYVYWFDEPDPKDYAFVMNGFRKLKEAAPDLVRMLTEQVEPDLVGGPNLWCHLTPDYRHDRAEERRKAGDRFWWYVCCAPKAPFCTLFIDHPATEMRVWLWQTWQRRIDGILVWSLDYWTSGTAYADPKRPQNPYEDPASWVDGYGTAKGAKVLWGNGDGRFLYPPEAAADANPPAPVLEGPVESLRLEMLRDGVEDYEYLAILRGLLAKHAKALPEAERKRLEALLEVPPEITADMTTFTKDPAPIEARRHAVAQAVEALWRR